MLDRSPLKLAVIGNCQVSGIASALKKLLPADEITACHVGADQSATLHVLGDLPRYDLVFSGFRDSEHHAGFDRQRLEEQCKQVAYWVPVIFTGFHPDCVYLGHHRGQLIRGPLDTYHSAIIAAAYSLGLSVERVPRLFNSLIYAKLGYFEAFPAAKQALLREHAAYGYDLTDHFERWLGRGCFMHTINHPRIDALATLANLLAMRVGIIADDAMVPATATVADDLEAHPRWPVYPELADKIGIAGSMTFLRSQYDLAPGQSREIELTEFIDASYAVYRGLSDLDLSAGRVGFVRERLLDMLRPVAGSYAAVWKTVGTQQASAIAGLSERGTDMATQMVEPTVDRDSVAARLATAESASKLRQFAIAAEQWNALRADFPEEAAYWHKTGEAYREAGLLERADEILGEAVNAFPGNLWLSHGYAVVAQRKGDWDQALRRAEAISLRFPAHPIGYLLKGEVLRDWGRLDEADAAFAAAVDRAGDDEWALRSYAESASSRRSWTDALQRWLEVQRRLPNLIRAQMAVAEALFELERLDEAEAALLKVLEGDPDNHEAKALRLRLLSRRAPEEAVVLQIRDQGLEAVLPERVANPDVFIEITSICNFACTYCVSPMKLREKKQMSMDTFRQVVEQVATITTRPVLLHLDGEPTSHPRFKEMALLVNSYRLPISLATNGSNLDPSFLDIWMDPLISMSTLPEELAKRHNKLDFDTYIDRIANYAAAWSRSESRQNLFFQIIHYPQADAEADAAYKERKDAFLLEFCRRADLYETCTEETSVQDESYRLVRKGYPRALTFVKQVLSSGGLYPLDGKMVERERATAGFCDSPWRQLVIHSNGSLGACCVDLSGGTTFATAAETETRSIKELWQSSPQINRLRQAFLEGRVERDVCQRCLRQGQVAFFSDGTWGA